MEENALSTFGQDLLTDKKSNISIEDLIASPSNDEEAVSPFNTPDLANSITIGDPNAGKIKILSVPSDKTGVGKYRSIDPHRMLHKLFKDDFFVEINPTPNYNDEEYLKNFDIVHIHKSPVKDYNHAMPIINKIKSLGCKLIIDVDDYWKVESFHPNYQAMIRFKINERLLDIINAADWVTTTTPIFANEIRKFNKNVVVIPNAIDPEEPQFQPHPIDNGKIKIGFLGGSCYDDKTEVLTDNGFKLFKDLEHFDKIATLNSNTNELEYQKPENYIEEYFNGKLNCATNKLIDYAVTPNHKMFIAESNRLGKGRKDLTFNLKTSENCYNTNFRVKRNCVWKGNNDKYFILPKHIYKDKSKIHTLPEIKILMEDWLKFFGFWLAEGWTSSEKYGKQVGICQFKSADFLEEINTIMVKYGFMPYINKNNPYQYRYCNQQLWSYLRQFGESHEKFIPRNILDLSSDLLSILLEWYIKGDGNIEKNKYKRMRAWTSSPRLADNIQEIAIKTGVSVTISNRGKRTSKIKKREIITQHDSYQIGFGKKSLHSNAYFTPLVKTNHQYQKDYNGYVYCVEVPNHIIFVRRNGKGFWCGNSHLDDIRLLNGMCNKLITDIDKIQLALIGFDLRGSIVVTDKNGKQKARPMLPTETVWYEYEKIFTSNMLLLKDYPNYIKHLQKYKQAEFDPELEIKMPYRRLWTEDIHNYAKNYNNLDISLAPLVENKFNSFKSQLKVVEAGFHKKALIAQDFGAYQLELVNLLNKDGTINPKGNAILIDSRKNHKQWYQAVKKLIDNPELITLLGNNLYELTNEKFDLRKVTKQRAEFYRSIL
jgi:glycosyltransferase involved in cell wall biosynthesis